MILLTALIVSLVNPSMKKQAEVTTSLNNHILLIVYCHLPIFYADNYEYIHTSIMPSKNSITVRSYHRLHLRVHLCLLGRPLHRAIA